MSEERMERKCVARSVQSKAAGVDCKKSSDAVQKPWPRSKKREVPGASGKNDAPRRSVPAPRGGWGGGGGGAGGRGGRGRSQLGAVARAEGSRLAEEEAELGSVFAPGPKKQSLNHLLNFNYSYAGRERDGSAAAARRPRRAAVAPHPLHRDLFLQASCQFAVKEGADYSRHLLDPDLPIAWDLVEQIVVRGAGAAECPVCLGRPAAARVTRCGHVYCWACALHYAAVHERSPPPCPVCAAPLHVALLKSARLQRWATPGEEVCMRLVRRARGSAVVEPAPERGARPQHSAAAVPAWGAADDLPYAKMFTITTQQVRDIIVEERQQLQDQILAEIDTSELQYLEQALRLLREQEEQLDLAAVASSAAPSAPVAHTASHAAPAVVESSAPPCRDKLDWFDVNEGDDPTVVRGADEGACALEPGEGACALELDEGACALDPDAAPFVSSDDRAEEFPLVEWAGEGAEEREGEADPPVLTDLDEENQAKYFYFYQAEDGQHVFLHGVDVRLLRASWGALAAAPPRIRGRLLRRETFSLTHQSRKHMPCAAHLPLHCPYDVVELELAPPHVTAAALRTFADELERRARVRCRAEREERRLERRAAAAAARPLAPHLASHAHFPPARSYSPPPPPSPPSPPAAAAAAHSPPAALSFAKMASTRGEWRVRAARAPSPPPHPAAGGDGEGEGEDGGEAPPRPALRLSDAIEAALHAVPASPASPAASTRGARRKNKPKLLFSTGVQRAA